MFTELRRQIAPERAAADLRRVLDTAEWRIELNGEIVPIETERFDVVARSCHTYEWEMGFGDHFRVLVAIGGVRSLTHGVPNAGICFATLWYTPSLTLITIDFSKAAP